MDRITVTLRAPAPLRASLLPPAVLAASFSGRQGPAGARGPAGQPGPAGSSGALTAPAAQPLSGHRALKLDGQGRALPLDARAAGDLGRLAGLSINAALVGDPVTVVAAGPITEPTWSWLLDVPVYVGADGALTQEPPVAPGFAWLQIVGLPTAPQTLFVAPREPLRLS